MGEETARLREEIDRTRENLTRDVDLLADKTSPSRIVERRVQRTRRGIGRGLSGLKEKVMGSSPTGAHRHATYGPTYTQDVYAVDRGYATEYGAAGTGYGTGADAGYDNGGSGVVGTVADKARSARESTTSAASQAREQVAHAGERAQDAAHGAVENVREQTEGNPLAAGLVAFGIGWLVSSLMPATQAEQQAALRAGETAREHRDALTPVIDEAKQAASEMGQNLQGEAQQAAQQVKERAQDAAGTVKEEAKTS